MIPAPAVVHVAVVRGPETAARAARTAAGRVALRALAAELVGADPADVTVRARCATCGGAHGRPVLGGSRALDGLHASVAHAGGLVVVAVSPDGPIGIDAEPRGREAPPGTTLAEWVRVEAVLKTDGRGLLVDPSLVRVEGDATGDRLDRGRARALPAGRRESRKRPRRRDRAARSRRARCADPGPGRAWIRHLTPQRRRTRGSEGSGASASHARSSAPASPAAPTRSAVVRGAVHAGSVQRSSSCRHAASPRVSRSACTASAPRL